MSTSTATSYLTVRGRQVRYRVEGTGTPVILLHGIGRSLEDWTEQHELLRARYRVYSLDLAGSGWSEPLDEPHTLATLARFVAGFLDAVGVAEPVHVVGNSLGGAVAMQLAVDGPHRVASLALVNSAGFGREVTIGLRLLAIRPLGRLLLRPSRLSARQIVRSLFHDPAFVTPARIEHTLTLAQQPHAAKAYLEIARALGTVRGVRPQWRKTLLRSLAELDIPTLIVWGDRDLILPAVHLNAARTHLPRAQVHLFPDTGHMPQIERAEAFSQLLETLWASAGHTGAGHSEGDRHLSSNR
ncbi:MAG TPA: alpha/beta fold hydrolase [Pseudonocardiaceae bacterium]|nr:alpha/beta fold hydrolase [Pseudonocardiaceae bacterium]